MLGSQGGGRRSASTPLPAAAALVGRCHIVGLVVLLFDHAQLVDRSDDIETGIGLGCKLVEVAIVQSCCCCCTVGVGIVAVAGRH